MCVDPTALRHGAVLRAEPRGPRGVAQVQARGDAQADPREQGRLPPDAELRREPDGERKAAVHRTDIG